YNPDELRGGNIGVFVGNCYIDTHEFFLRDAESINENIAPGCMNGLLASRISHVFGFKGISTVGDSACSSGLVSLNLAVQAIRRGEVEAAVVGGTNLCLRPGTSIEFVELGAISDDGVCRSFDADVSSGIYLQACLNCRVQNKLVNQSNYTDKSEVIFVLRKPFLIKKVIGVCGSKLINQWYQLYFDDFELKSFPDVQRRRVVNLIILRCASVIVSGI
ncbi:fatty acid synthase, partial [Trichonephila inaurata madagascariensis]